MARFAGALLGCVVLAVAGCTADDATPAVNSAGICASAQGGQCVCADGGDGADCSTSARRASPLGAAGSGVAAAPGGSGDGARGASAGAAAPDSSLAMTRTGDPGSLAAGSGGAAATSAAVGGNGASVAGSWSNGCGSGGWIGKASTAGAATAARGYGDIEFQFSTKNAILSLRTTMQVPPKPKPSGTVFLWPGLQPLPGGKNFNPVGNGVLQPVLTWGGTCADDAPANSYANWWISAQYVNIYGNDQKHMGCLGGKGMDVQVGDLLDIGMSVDGTIWNQTVTDEQSGETVTYDIDMLGQAQLWGIFEIELPTATKPAADVIFGSVEITLASPEPESCQPSARGTNDFFSTPIASVDGLRCCIERMALRAKGVPATTGD